MASEYIGTCWTRITIHGVPLDITKDHVVAFFAGWDVAHGMSKASVTSVDFTLQGDLDRKNFPEIANLLTCRGGGRFL